MHIDIEIPLKSYFDFGLSITIQSTKLDCNLDLAIQQYPGYLQSHSWSSNLQTIADHFLLSYKSFLPKITYSDRTGGYAVGLNLLYKYAKGDLFYCSKRVCWVLDFRFTIEIYP